MVVTVPPVFGHAPHFVEAGEDVAVEHLGAVGFVEALDVSVLGRLVGLGVNELDAALLRPLLERGTDELGAVVQTQALRRAEHFDQLINGTDDALWRQAGADLDAQGFKVVVIIDVEGAEALSPAAA